MKSILDKSFVYVPASKTNIRETFRKHGWVGPEEARLAREWFTPGPPAPGEPTVMLHRSAWIPTPTLPSFY